MPKSKNTLNRIAQIIDARVMDIAEVERIDYIGQGAQRRVYRVSLKTDAYTAIGTNPHEWQMIIRNEKQPDLNQATHIARMLGVDIKELNSKPKKAAA